MYLQIYYPVTSPLFEELFSVVGSLYQNVIVPMGIALLLMILIWQLFKSMFGKVGINAEEPIELIGRSSICLFFVVASKPVINYILKIAGTPYQWGIGTDINGAKFFGVCNCLRGDYSTARAWDSQYCNL
ncbi:MAG: hypothetical protein ACLURP_02240 [Ruminococcus sp.]